MYDMVIKNGSIIDGTGSPAFHADIAINGGKIVKVARNIKDGKQVIDAKGLTVTPGFIDSHSHADNAMLTFPEMIEKIEQGITTSIGWFYDKFCKRHPNGCKHNVFCGSQCHKKSRYRYGRQTCHQG